MWEVVIAPMKTDQSDRLLREGWEPFGVTPVGLPPYNLYHFRRQLPEPTFVQSGETCTICGQVCAMGHTVTTATGKAHFSCDRVYAKTRIETLKEVGKWVAKNHSYFRGLGISDCDCLLTVLEDGLRQGRLP